MYKSINPYERNVRDGELKKVFKKHREQFDDRIEDAKDLREYDFALAVAKLLVVPEDKEPIDHTRDLALAAKEAYKRNATGLADKQHSAARILAEYYGFDWKEEIIEQEEQRVGELGSN